jgi:hypothetical protein
MPAASNRPACTLEYVGKFQLHKAITEWENDPPYTDPHTVSVTSFTSMTHPVFFFALIEFGH